jgi:excisionase family DNA binding protein
MSDTRGRLDASSRDTFNKPAKLAQLVIFRHLYHRSLTPQNVVEFWCPTPGASPMPALPLPADLIDVNTAARLLGVHVSAIYRWIASGRLSYWQIGGRKRLSRAEVLAFPQRCGPDIAVTTATRVVSHEQAKAILRQERYA